MKTTVLKTSGTVNKDNEWYLFDVMDEDGNCSLTVRYPLNYFDSNMKRDNCFFATKKFPFQIKDVLPILDQSISELIGLIERKKQLQ